MDELEVEVAVAEGVEPPAASARVEAAVRHVLRAEGVSRAEISVALLGDGAIAALNREYLGRDRPTDVIAFHLHDPGEPPLGDVYLGVEQAARQAGGFGATAEEELLRLAVHGTLHVLGWDHPEGEERTASPMFERQEALLRELLSTGG
jgi:probable rRNA maturation factor